MTTMSFPRLGCAWSLVVLFCLLTRTQGFKLPQFEHMDQFVDIVRNSTTTPDKVMTDKVSGHNYEVMYGVFLMPIVNALKSTNHKAKVLEIGLGCSMYYGPGKSLELWRQLYGKHADIWEAEYDAACIEKSKKEGQLKGVNLLTGDQADKTVLQRWVKESAGEFHVIIDDGGHSNEQIHNSFDVLFHEALLPGDL